MSSSSASLFVGPEASPSNAAYFTPDELNQHLQDIAWQRWNGLFGQTIPQYDYGWWWYGITAHDAAVPLSSASVGGANATGVISDTNTQVTGIDEADFIENDGQYLYIARGSQLTIIDASPGNELSVTSQVDLDGYVEGAFLEGDRLTIITQSNGPNYPYPIIQIAIAPPMPIWNWNPQITVTVFDVSDRSAPNVVEQTVLDGSFREARAVGSSVYLVLQNNLDLPEPKYVDTPVVDTGNLIDGKIPLKGAVAVDNVAGASDLRMAVPGFWGGPTSPKVIANRTYETFEDYLARVGDQLTELSFPHVFSAGTGGELVDLGVVDGNSVVRPDDANESSLLTIAAINTSDGQAGVADSASLFSPYASAVYMTSDAMVVATSDYTSDATSWQANTRLDRLTIQGTDIEWQASGTVAGTLLNQFSLDEHNGFLRVATHVNSSRWIETRNGGMEWSAQNDNSVFVLDTVGASLDVAGSIQGIAPGEQLFAARFLGDQGYLVTFLQVDPLFTLDLSDPTQPAIVGQLEIPGFSNYLQPAGEGQLFGIGQERTPGTWTSRLHVSLFDVTDLASPQQLDREYLGSDAGWAYSSAQYDHHALAYYSDGFLVLPFISESWGTQANGGSWSRQDTLAILQINVDGIATLGQIASAEPIVRSARIDNVLYVITERSVAAYDLADLTLLKSVDIANWKQLGVGQNLATLQTVELKSVSLAANSSRPVEQALPLGATMTPAAPESQINLIAAPPPGVSDWSHSDSSGGMQQTFSTATNVSSDKSTLPPPSPSQSRIFMQGSSTNLVNTLDTNSVDQFWQQAGEQLLEQSVTSGLLTGVV